MSSQQFYLLDARTLLQDGHQCWASSGLGTSNTLDTQAGLASKSRIALREMNIEMKRRRKTFATCVFKLWQVVGQRRGMAVDRKGILGELFSLPYFSKNKDSSCTLVEEEL